MKRMIALCLALLMFTATAFAAEWAAGLGPTKPYTQSGEADWSKNTGHMLWTPNQSISLAGAKTLFIFLPREDVKPGNGELTIRSEDGTDEQTVSFSDPDYVHMRPLLEEELQSLMWGEGVVFEVTLPVSVRLNTTYYVDMERSCIIDEVRRVGNVPITGRDSWSFSTDSEYGVSAVEYRRRTGDGEADYEIVGTAQDGDEVRFDLVIGGAAKSATLMAYDNYIDDNDGIAFEHNFFTETCEVTGTVSIEDPAWYVIFWDTEEPPLDPDAQEDHIVDVVEF